MTNLRAKIVGVRLSDTEAKKLDELARKTERTRSQVLRLLLARVEVADLAIRLGRRRMGEGA